MLIRDIIGTTLAGLAAAVLALAPGLFQTPGPSAPGSAAVAGGPSGARAPVEAVSALVHPCPETSESECRAVFLPPLADNDNDGAAHTAHQPQVRICGPLAEGVSIQSVSSCDDAGTGEEVEFFPFGCGNVNDCVEVTGNHFHANWHIPAGEGGDDDGDDEDDDGDDEAEEDDDDEGGGKGKGKGKDDDDDDDDEDEDDEGDEAGDGDAIESGFYLINVRLNGNSAGGVVIEVGGAAGGGGGDDDDDGDDDDSGGKGKGKGTDDDDGDDDDDGGGGEGACSGGSGAAPFFCRGQTVPIRFRLHDKIVG